MLKETVIGISQAISDAVGDDYGITNNKTEQGFQVPCFLITPLIVMNDHVVMNRYKRIQPFMIQYFPKEQEQPDEVLDTASEFADVTETLFECLEYITVDGNLVRGTAMNAEVVDEVLHFSVNYDLFMFKTGEPIENMEDLTMTVGMKGMVE